MQTGRRAVKLTSFLGRMPCCLDSLPDPVALRLGDKHSSCNPVPGLPDVLRRLQRIWTSAQVLRLGAPVTALSLSPVMDMLATTHVNRRGIYLWSNAAIYGSGADVRPSELPVDARLPALASGGPPAGVNPVLLLLGHTFA